MEKRAVLFLIISLLIVLLYPYFLKKFGLVQEPKPQKVIQKKEVKTRTLEAPAITGEITETLMPLAEEKLITVETELYRAVLSTRGAVITQWELKNYTEGDYPLIEPIHLYRPLSEGVPPLSIMTGDHVSDSQLREAIYQLQEGDITLDEYNPTDTIAFILDDPVHQRYIVKSLTFHYNSYAVDVKIDIRGIEEPYEIYLGTNFGIVDWGGVGGGQQFIGFIGPLSMIGDELHKDKIAKIEATVRHQGKPSWTALQDKYFIAALIPTEGKAALVRKTHDEAVTVSVELSSDAPQTLRLYAGPKELDRLAALEVGLEESIDFGWSILGSWSLLKAIAKPLFQILQFLHHYTHNYGVAIILLTVGIRTLFIPLMHKSYKSMKAMQVLQPAVAALQKKHKDDRERLNREMMALYKKQGANPLGGCLPILLQIPVFITLFNVLYMTIELRQAPFILWITDLSSKDPYYVLPIIMGASMMLQQKMQPTTMDPRQAKLLLFLPVFFTFLFLNFPSGLVLYWLTNNLLTILQQHVTMKYLEKPA